MKFLHVYVHMERHEVFCLSYIYNVHMYVHTHALSHTHTHTQEKRFWRRYIYLWIYYALYEELLAKDPERTRQVYRACLEVLPHHKFTFAKIWLMYAHFEVRQKDVTAARKALGMAIGKCPKPKLFKGYIELELQLREFDRCRKLYEKFLEFNVADCNTWIKYAELEGVLGDTDRARAVFELAVNQPLMDMPELLWKAYVDFEVEQEAYSNVRDIYERLLERTKHVKVWLSYGKFESSTGLTDSAENTRQVYGRADKALKNSESSEERAMLLEAWRDFERESGDGESLATIERRMPRRVKKRRKVYLEDGSDSGWEEYWDYIFPDDETAAPNLKLLQMARMWKRKQAVADESSSESEEEEEEDGGEGEGDGSAGKGGGFDDRDTDYSESSASEAEET